MSDARLEPNLDPEYLQRNVQSLSQIGGVYDWLAEMVERDHAHILGPWREKTGAPTLYDIWRASRPDLADYLTARQDADNLEPQ